MRLVAGVWRHHGDKCLYTCSEHLSGLSVTSQEPLIADIGWLQQGWSIITSGQTYWCPLWTGGATQLATADSTNTEIRRQCLHGASDISSSCHHLGIKENVLWILSCWYIWIYEPRQVFPFPQTLQGNKAPGKSSVVMISQESCEESSVKLLIGSISDQEKHLKSIRRMLNLTHHYKILWVLCSDEAVMSCREIFQKWRLRIVSIPGATRLRYIRHNRY